MFFVSAIQNEHLLSGIVALAAGCVVGYFHVRKYYWAILVTVVTILMVNMVAVFAYFPPFGRYAAEGMPEQRVVEFGIHTAITVMVCLYIYFDQHKLKAVQFGKSKVRKWCFAPSPVCTCFCSAWF